MINPVKGIASRGIFIFLFAILWLNCLFAVEGPTKETRIIKKRKAEFAISFDSYLKLKKESSGVILIDVRPADNFEKLKAPGSLNIPLFAIKAQAFLKPKPVVLINEGYNYSLLEEECVKLKELGFQPRILEGGLNYLRQKNALFEGGILAAKELNRVPPKDFFMEKDYDNWLLIDVSSPENNEAKVFFTETARAAFTEDKAVFVSRIKARIEKFKSKSFLSVLIFNNDGSHYAEVEKAVEKIGFYNIFYLKGGLDGYGKYVKDKAAIPQKRVTVTSVGISDGKMINKPCRSCQ